MASNLALLLLAAGLLARFWHRSLRWSGRLLVAGALVALVFSLGAVARALLHPLEQRYPAWVPGITPALSIEHIVLLTAWAGDNPDLPASVRLNDSSASRVIVTVELWRRHPHASVIVSGDVRNARDLGDVLLALGLPADRLVLESQSRNTADSAQQVAAVVRRQVLRAGDFGGPSAEVDGHIRQGRLPSRCRYLPTIACPDASRRQLHPGPRALYASNLAVHEYLGLVWYRMLGRS